MQFSAVVGQEAAKRGFIAMKQRNQLPHALLIAGREGTGGLAFSLAASQYMLCERPGSTDSCGECAGCRKVSRLEHADLHFTYPVYRKQNADHAGMSSDFGREWKEFVQQFSYGSTYDWLQFINAENKQGNISAGECREVIEKLNLKSYEGGYKIQIIWRPEVLGREGNMLLKLIEEPSPNTLILLVAEEPDDMLATIRSRTQLVALAPLSVPEISRALIDRSIVTDEGKALQLAQLASGSYLEALRLAQSLADTDLLQDLRSWFIALFRNDGPALIKFAESWSKGGREAQKNFLAYVQAMLSYGLRATYQPDGVLYLSQGDAAFVKRLAEKQWSPETYARLSAYLSETGYFIERNASAKVQMAALSLRVLAAMQGKAGAIV